MKKVILSIALIGMSLGANAQNETVNGDLTVKGYINLRKSDSSGTGGFNISGSGTYIHLSGAGLISKTDNQQDLGVSSYRFKNLWLGSNAYINGNVGIGTISPTEKLEIVDNNASLRIRSTNAVNNSTLKLDWGINHGHHISYNANTAITYFDSKHNVESNKVYSDVLFRRSVNNIMSPTFVIKGYTGNVGIGTTNPKSLVSIVKSNVGTDTDGLDNSLLYLNNGSNRDGSIIIKSHGTPENEIIGAIKFHSSPDGANYSQSSIKAIAGSHTTANALAFFTSTSNTQQQGEEVMRIQGNNVGIGTTNPGSKLEVKVGAGDYIRVNSSDATISASNKFGYKISELGIDVGELSYARDGQGVLRLNTLVNNDIAFGTNNSEKMRISKTGNIGIGTNSPSSKLHVDNGYIKVVDNTYNDWFLMKERSDATHRAGFKTHDNASFSIWVDNSEKMRISKTGNIGIGTSNPDAKLAVNGKIHTKEVKVDLVGWSDFVFKKEYKLPTLKEVEKQIKEKGHLKDIPSEKEVLKNGIQLGEMNAKLLQKIEELTLYTIEQEKKIKKQEGKLIKLSNELKSLKGLSQRLAEIERQLKNK